MSQVKLSLYKVALRAVGPSDCLAVIRLALRAVIRLIKLFEMWQIGSD